jgi:hypothetical protein
VFQAGAPVVPHPRLLEAGMGAVTAS